MFFSVQVQQSLYMYVVSLSEMSRKLNFLRITMGQLMKFIIFLHFCQVTDVKFLHVYYWLKSVLLIIIIIVDKMKSFEGQGVQQP